MSVPKHFPTEQSGDVLRAASCRSESDVLRVLAHEDFNLDLLEEDVLAVALGKIDSACLKIRNDLPSFLRSKNRERWLDGMQYLNVLKPYRIVRILQLCERPEMLVWSMMPDMAGHEVIVKAAAMQISTLMQHLKTPAEPGKPSGADGARYWAGLLRFLGHLGPPWLPEGMPRRAPILDLQKWWRLETPLPRPEDLNPAWTSWVSEAPLRVPQPRFHTGTPALLEGWKMTRMTLVTHLLRGTIGHDLARRSTLLSGGSIEGMAALLGGVRAATGRTELGGTFNPFWKLLSGPDAGGKG
jgi:hypothetical protein